MAIITVVMMMMMTPILLVVMMVIVMMMIKSRCYKYTVHKKKCIFLMLQLVTNCLTETRHI